MTLSRGFKHVAVGLVLAVLCFIFSWFTFRVGVVFSTFFEEAGRYWPYQQDLKNGEYDPVWNMGDWRTMVWFSLLGLSGAWVFEPDEPDERLRRAAVGILGVSFVLSHARATGGSLFPVSMHYLLSTAGVLLPVALRVSMREAVGWAAFIAFLILVDSRVMEDGITGVWDAPGGSWVPGYGFMLAEPVLFCIDKVVLIAAGWVAVGRFGALRNGFDAPVAKAA